MTYTLRDADFASYDQSEDCEFRLHCSQNPVGGNTRVGSTPTSGICKSGHYRIQLILPGFPSFEFRTLLQRFLLERGTVPFCIEAVNFNMEVSKMTVRKHPHSSCWYYDFWHRKRRYQGSTKQTSKVRAKEHERRLINELEACMLWVRNKPGLGFSPKGRKERAAALPPVLLAELLARQCKSGWVLKGANGGQVDGRWDS
jgi:hypothetical protein